jgi:ABC-type transport system involved in multi-copper enzyme maturation permease subunit
MTQTLALFLDAYRELNAKKLFWITLILSGLVVGVFAAFSINKVGITFLHWEIDTQGRLTSEVMPPAKFYIFVFANVAIPWWFSIGAGILALVSTASIFPDFIASGSIELTLSKPISRVRLFLTKYLTGLLFVGLQVLAFTTAAFLVIWIRGGSREFQIFLAVPIVVLTFSYLYCICVLLGLITRSTIASLLLTVLAYFGLWSLHTVEGIFLLQRLTTEVNVERAAGRVERAEATARRALDQLKEKGEALPSEKGPLPGKTKDDLEAVNPMLAGVRAARVEAKEKAESWRRLSGGVVLAKTLLPKTQETTGLLDRWLISEEDKSNFTQPRDESPSDEFALFGRPDLEVARRFEEAVRGRSTTWIIGTSLLFQGFILAISAWIFSRRDF